MWGLNMIFNKDSQDFNTAVLILLCIIGFIVFIFGVSIFTDTFENDMAIIREHNSSLSGYRLRARYNFVSDPARLQETIVHMESLLHPDQIGKSL